MPTIPEILLGRTPAEREILLRALPEHRVQAANRAFAEWAHRGQVAPEGDWRSWVLMAGRGFGKTRAGAEWVLGLVRSSLSPSSSGEGLSALRIDLVAATGEEARADGRGSARAARLRAGGGTRPQGRHVRSLPRRRGHIDFAAATPQETP